MKNWKDILQRSLVIFFGLAVGQFLASQSSGNDASLRSTISILNDPATVISLLLLTAAILAFQRLRLKALWLVGCVVLTIGGAGTILPERFTPFADAPMILPPAIALVVMLVLLGAQSTIFSEIQPQFSEDDIPYLFEEDDFITLDLDNTSAANKNDRR